MPTKRDVKIIIMGLGNIGRVLLRQLLETREVVARRTGLKLVPIGLADISGLLADPNGLLESTLRAALAAAQAGQLLDTLPGIRPLDKIAGLLRKDVILADVTASPQTDPTLRSALKAGCGIVLANKIPLAGAWAAAKPLFEYPRLRYEVTVGAGLPVIGTLQYLLNTGDEVIAIEGCLSGTLGYWCTELERGVTYSAAVSEAYSLRYTEPDPRDDLSGRDVARKALILARSAGWPLELADLAVEPLYPEELSGVSVQTFIADAGNLDANYARRIEQARAKGQVLRYVARVGPEEGHVGLVGVPKDSPLGTLRGPGNYIALYTRRYDEVPLVIAGPGAGPEVTAAGVLEDLIDLARQM
jgi:homoserine dehydrogenase